MTFPVLLFALTIQAAKAFLVAFPPLIEVLGSIMTFLDDIPSTFCREREKVELKTLKETRFSQNTFNVLTLYWKTLLLTDQNGYK